MSFIHSSTFHAQILFLATKTERANKTNEHLCAVQQRPAINVTFWLHSTQFHSLRSICCLDAARNRINIKLLWLKWSYEWAKKKSPNHLHFQTLVRREQRLKMCFSHEIRRNQTELRKGTNHEKITFLHDVSFVCILVWMAGWCFFFFADNSVEFNRHSNSWT